MLGWGILGAGGIAATVGADIAAAPGSELVAVGARSLQRARDFAGRFGIPRAHGSYAELVADPAVDIVYIATTHGQHHDHALLALRAGKPVLVEKAFTLTAAQAREVAEEAAARGLFCMEAMWLRFNPLIRRGVDLVRAGAIGDPIGVRADLSAHFDYDPAHRLFDLAAGGGALLDLGVYPVNFAWLFLGAPAAVSATGTLSPTGSDVTAAMQWSYPDGRFAQLACSAAAHNPFAGLVTGTSGWLEFAPRLHRPLTLTVSAGGATQVFTDDPVGNGYGHQVAEVERCLAAGLTQSPVMTMADTVAILDLLDDVRAQLGVRYPGE